ncbi:MAG: gliding motility-associated C-terminal domain-containing protein [Bacteroidales bacterium]|nr:gliding motility-associated C-terminal domain-containing protein [Bacteroidales bacterium]
MASPAITNQNDDGGAQTWLQNHNVTTCLSSQPRGSWYLFSIAQSGDLLIEIVQRSQVLPNGQPNMSSNGYDVDFACWGPFDAFDEDEFKQRLCNGTYTLSSGPSASNGGNHHVQNHSNGNTGGYPIGNLVDCSYDRDDTEWCFIPNAQTGQFYLLLVTNYNGATCYLGFTPQTITGASDPNANNRGSTNCQLLNCLRTNNEAPCLGANFRLSCTVPRNELPSNVQYRWIAPNGTILATTSDSSYTVTATDASMSGRYELVLVGTNPERRGHIDVNVQVTPISIQASNTTICQGDSIRLSTPYNAFYENTLYDDGYHRWFGPDGNRISNETSVLLFPSESGTYTLKVKNGESNCTNTDSIRITVNPIPQVTISAGKTQLCYGESTKITAHCGEEVSYNWSTGSSDSIINVKPLKDSIFKVEVKLLTGARCSMKDSIKIKVDPEISLSSTVVPTHCGKSIGSITMHASGGTGHFTFASTPPTAVFTDSTALRLPAGSYTIKATDGLTCTQSSTVTVSSIPGPTPCFLFTSNDNVNMVITNCTQPQSNTNRYTWDFGDGNFSSDIHPTHEYLEPGRYTVKMEVIDEFDCMDSLSQDYKINGPVYIPNAFTPNNDTYNDVLEVIGNTIQKDDFLWAIYDRHGSLVFISNDPKKGWDGKILNTNKEAPSGVYAYRLKYLDVNGNFFERDGSITLIR